MNEINCATTQTKSVLESTIDVIESAKNDLAQISGRVHSIADKAIGSPSKLGTGECVPIEANPVSLDGLTDILGGLAKKIEETYEAVSRLEGLRIV